MADENVKPTASPTFIHGIGSSQAIDTAGEIVDLAGIDCSSLVGGAFNFEHKSDLPAQIVGKILEYKKIFSEKDCENDAHKYFWDKCKTPYLYVMGRLFDDKKDSSRELAALFIDDAEHPDEQPMVGLSIEGSKVEKKGIIVTKSIARKITCTGNPANKTCVAEIVKNPNAEKPSTDTDSIFKYEPAHTIELLSKAEKGVNTPMSSHIKGKDMKPGSKEMLGMSRMGNMAGGGYPEHAVSIAENKLDEIKRMPKPNLGKAEVPGSNIKPAHPAPTPSKAVKGAPGWSHTGGGNFHHPEHGTVSVIKEGSNFNVKHGGGLAGVAGKKGSFGSSKEAGAHAGDYMRSLGQGKTQAPAMHNRPSPSMAKALMGGLGTGGMNLPQESTDKKNSRGLFNPDVDKIQGRMGVMGGVGMAKGGEKNPKISQVRQKGTFEQKGVHMPPLLQAGGGESVMGSHVRNPSNTGSGSKEMARRHAQSNLNELKQMPKPKLEKAMTAGSGMAGPGNLVQGAALAPESMGKKMKKSTWLARAEAEYSAWEKREQFENFMAKHMPDLAKHEIVAIGQTLALRKSLRAERKLSKMVDMGQDSWVKKSEKPKKVKPPELKGIVESDVTHIEPDPYLKGRETIHLKTGHKLEGHPAGKFKAGDKVIARQHIMGTHLLDHKK